MMMMIIIINLYFRKVKKGSLLIDSSTIDPAVSKELAKAAETMGAVFMDAPVSGGKSSLAACLILGKLSLCLQFQSLLCTLVALSCFSLLYVQYSGLLLFKCITDMFIITGIFLGFRSMLLCYTWRNSFLEIWYSGPFNLTSFIKLHFYAVIHIPLASICFFLLGKNWLSLSSSVAFSLIKKEIMK